MFEKLDKSKVYVAFSSSTTFLSKAIKWFTKSKYSHSFLLHWSDQWNGWLALGADQGGWIYTPAESENIVDLYEVPVNLWTSLASHRDWLGAPYDVGGLLGMSIVEVAWHWLKLKVSNPTVTHGAWWCSEIVCRVLEDAGLKLGLVPGNCDPQEVRDALVTIQGVVSKM